MAWYKTGTVAVTPGSNAVIGTGTAFIRNARVGDAFRGPDGEWYEVTNIASDTALSIAPDYQGPAVAAGAYSLAPMQGYVKDSADALRAATQVIASGVADMQEQVAAATEAAESAEQSKVVATDQAGIATAAAEASTDGKDAAQLAAQQSQGAAQASGAAADRADAAKNSIVQSEEAATASALAAKASADRAEQVTTGKASSGDNNDITSLRALTVDGFERLRQGIAPMVGATTSTDSTKGLVPVASVADRLKVLSGAGTWVALPSGAAWGNITGSLANQADLIAALGGKLNNSDIAFTYLYPSGTSAAPPTIAANTRIAVANPYPASPIIVVVEVFLASTWGEAGWDGNSGTGSSAFGTKAGQVMPTDQIIVQSGVTGVSLSGAGNGSLVGAVGTVTSAPYRLKVFKFKGSLTP